MRVEVEVVKDGLREALAWLKSKRQDQVVVNLQRDVSFGHWRYLEMEAMQCPSIGCLHVKISKVGPIKRELMPRNDEFFPALVGF